ncbi:transposase [Vibrio vulnificus]|nr:transposase [Vibrio vulnificus]
MLKTIEEVKTNMAYQWFLGYDFHDKVPQSSTFWKNYERRYKDNDLLNRFFYRLFMNGSEIELISAEHVLVHSPYVKASMASW